MAPLEWNVSRYIKTLHYMGASGPCWVQFHEAKRLCGRQPWSASAKGATRDFDTEAEAKAWVEAVYMLGMA